MDYRDGFEDGIKFTREVVINNIRKWAEESNNDDEANTMEALADRIEFGKLDDDA